MSELIDSYRDNREEDKYKKDFYNKRLSFNEKRKTKKIRERIKEYTEELKSKETMVGKGYFPEKEIKYYERTGYISLVKTDYDNIDVYYYGLDEDEAFYDAIIDYEMYLNMQIELHYRDALNEDYRYRFEDDQEDYHGRFYSAELSLQDFKYHYKEYIPEQILLFFEKYIKEYIGKDYRYDISENRIVKRQKQKIKAYN